MQLESRDRSTSHMLALIKVIRDFPGIPKLLQWQLLIILDEAPAPVAFEYIYRSFNKSQQTHSNYMYYTHIGKLLDQGFVKQEYSVRGWRLWSITPAGRDQVNKLNTAAQQYLNKKAG